MQKKKNFWTRDLDDLCQAKGMAGWNKKNYVGTRYFLKTLFRPIYFGPFSSVFVNGSFVSFSHLIWTF